MRFGPLLSALALAGCASSPTPALDAAASLASAETAFAAHSVREDLRAAFLTHFTHDGVLVRNGWINGNAYFATQSAPPIVLDWRPVFTEVAQSGDLGLSTGPWKTTSRAKPDAPASFGQFVSVWRREDGQWKVAVDIGIGHGNAALWDEPLETVILPGRAALTSGGIETAELEFVTDAHPGGLVSAYGKHGSDRLRFYREGHPPAIGKSNALASSGMSDTELDWTIERTEMSRSRDFGYSRGSYAAVGSPTKPLGYFMRAWHVENGQWRIVLDVASPASP